MAVRYRVIYVVELKSYLDQIINIILYHDKAWVSQRQSSTADRPNEVEDEEHVTCGVRKSRPLMNRTVCFKDRRVMWQHKRKKNVRRNNSSSQKYAAVQPGPLSTGSMTAQGGLFL